MKYYITDANFNVLSVHPDRDSAKAVWDVNWKAGVDVYLESEENHLKNIEWAKAYKERKKKREEYAISVMLKEEAAQREAIEDLERKEIEKIKDDLWKDMSKDIMVEFNEEEGKLMAWDCEEAAQREAEEEDNK